MTVTTAVEIVTPAAARDYLAASNGNRPVKPAKVAAYGRDMSSGAWQMNGEPIIFDEHGALVDGHHRLRAVINADAAIQTLVVRGVAAAANVTIDMGASRTAADAIGFFGIPNASQVQTIVTALMCLRNGKPRSVYPSTSEILAFIAEYPRVAASASFASSHRDLPRMAAMIGALHFLSPDDDTIQTFAGVLKTGVPSYPGCAAHALRERLIRDAMIGRTTTRDDRQRLVVAAWNKFIRREPVKKLITPDTYAIGGWT